MIPQSCRFRGVKYECGLSISCVVGGGRPLDLCSGGMIWACCVDRDAEEQPQVTNHHQSSDIGVLNNASKLEEAILILRIMNALKRYKRYYWKFSSRVRREMIQYWYFYPVWKIPAVRESMLVKYHWRNLGSFIFKIPPYKSFNIYIQIRWVLYIHWYMILKWSSCWNAL